MISGTRTPSSQFVRFSHCAYSPCDQGKRWNNTDETTLPSPTRRKCAFIERKLHQRGKRQSVTAVVLCPAVRRDPHILVRPNSGQVPAVVAVQHHHRLVRQTQSVQLTQDLPRDEIGLAKTQTTRTGERRGRIAMSQVEWRGINTPRRLGHAESNHKHVGRRRARGSVNEAPAPTDRWLTQVKRNRHL